MSVYRCTVFLALLRNVTTVTPFMTSVTSFYERSNSGYAIKPKKQ